MLQLSTAQRPAAVTTLTLLLAAGRAITRHCLGLDMPRRRAARWQAETKQRPHGVRRQRGVGVRRINSKRREWASGFERSISQSRARARTLHAFTRLPIKLRSRFELLSVVCSSRGRCVCVCVEGNTKRVSRLVVADCRSRHAQSRAQNNGKVRARSGRTARSGAQILTRRGGGLELRKCAGDSERTSTRKSSQTAAHLKRARARFSKVLRVRSQLEATRHVKRATFFCLRTAKFAFDRAFEGLSLQQR